MKRRMAWLIVPLVAAVVAAWLSARDRGEAAASYPASYPTRSVAVDGRGQLPDGLHRSDPAPSSRPVPTPGSAGAGAAASSGGSAPSGDRRSPPPASAAPGTGPAGPAAVRPAIRPSAAGTGPAGGLVDRTGWADQRLGQQLNQEFMPLASECVDQAKARDPGLRGRLGFSMMLAPVEDGRAIVASVKLRPDNEILDPELIECIRESSFSLDLQAPRDFDITMPIAPDDP